MVGVLPTKPLGTNPGSDQQCKATKPDKQHVHNIILLCSVFSFLSGRRYQGYARSEFPHSHCVLTTHHPHTHCGVGHSTAITEEA